MNFIRATTTGDRAAAAGRSPDAEARGPFRAVDVDYSPVPVLPTPSVSIGLPVYNGAKYLRGAIEAILAQTFTDFELILCDNGSTDQTQSICTAFAARDPRVRYHRNPTNIGAAGNFNLAFKLARGRYFKWAAHDDLHAPDYLERCVALLEADPSAVLSHTGTRVIDDANRDVQLLPGKRPPEMRGRPELYEEDLYDPPRGLDASQAAERLEGLLCQTKWCFEIFGLMRADVLRATPLHLTFYGSDKVLLAAMALRGRFVETAEPLFLRRFHPGQSSSKGSREQALWMSAGGRSQYVPPQFRCLQWYVRLIARSGLPLRERLRCLRSTGHWMLWIGGLIVRQRDERGFLYRLANQFGFGGTR